MTWSPEGMSKECPIAPILQWKTTKIFFYPDVKYCISNLIYLINCSFSLLQTFRCDCCDFVVIQKESDRPTASVSDRDTEN